MDELDNILNDLDNVESSTQTISEELPEIHDAIPEVEPEESSTQTTESDSDTEVLSEDQRDAEHNINLDPVYEEDNTDYLMSKETAELFLEFGTRYLNLMLDRKKIGEDVKALKQEFAEQGVSVNAAVKVLNSINSEHKRSATELAEIEKLRDLFKKSKNIMDQISDLSAKD
jgi:septation ring formation regulator EzrA